MQVVAVVAFFAVASLDERAVRGFRPCFLEAAANALELAVFV
jgi:hypothetical protein